MQAFANERLATRMMAIILSVITVLNCCSIGAAHLAVNNSTGTSSGNSITFDLPLTVPWKTEDGGEYQLIAFTTKSNAAILAEVAMGNIRRDGSATGNLPSLGQQHQRKVVRTFHTPEVNFLVSHHRVFTH
jgi:hypothetical protein